jgi:NitT/TauT family transport system substrate-binding protein
LINYDAAHPDDKIAAVFVISERSAMSIVTLKKYNINKPQDLVGKKIADQQGEASRNMFPAFAKANNIDPNSVTWVSVAPNLRQPILVKGDADAAAGHRFTILVGLRALGVKDDEVTLFPYADWGVRAFGNSVVVKKEWAAAHPEAMRGFLRCTASAIRLSIAKPQQAITWLKKYNSLINEDSELQGLDFSNNLAIITDETKKNGLTTFSKERLDEILTQVSDALQIKKPAADDIWDPDYLPPASELKLQ